ncbi:MAG: hypothetical protein ACRC7S_17495 [Cetobacterium sp.]
MNEFFRTRYGQQLLKDISTIAKSLEVIANNINDNNRDDYYNWGQGELTSLTPQCKKCTNCKEVGKCSVGVNVTNDIILNKIMCEQFLGGN